MLSISPPARGAGKGEYYLLLAREDYYTGGGEPQGKWVCEGARELGLHGVVERTELRNIMRGFDPAGKHALVQNAGEEDRRCFWDLTFSAPKSVSVAWSQASPEVAREFQAAQGEAARAGLKFIEDNCAATRRGKGGARTEKVKLIAGAFEHGTSRAQDPQLHTHCLVQNLGLRADGTTGTINSQIIYKNQMAAGALYRVELAFQIEQRCGLSAEQKGKAFELAGVSPELIAEFSKRREAIERELERLGLKSARAASVAALNSREAKEAVSRKELFSRWQDTGRKLGWSTKELEKLMRKEMPRRNMKHEKEEALKTALQQITSRMSYFSKVHLVRFTAEAAAGRGLSAKDVLALVDDGLSRSPEIVALGLKRGELQYTTKEVLQMEQSLINGVLKGTQDERFIVDKQTVENVLKKKHTLSLEQRRAVEHLTRNPGRVQIVSGMAGTGKSFMLGAARECWEKAGFRVLGGALAGKAAQGLYEGSGIKSDTLHRLLTTINSGAQEINSRTIMVVDEAAMVGTKQLYQVYEQVSKGGGKLVLVGDERQLQSIEAGGAFVGIAEKIGEAELTENRRQEEFWAKQAVALFSKGVAAEALQEYALRGLVTVKKSKAELLEALISDWAMQGLSSPKNELILASEKDDVFELNRLAQLQRKTAGVLSGKSIRLRDREFRTGDRVLITRNSRLLGVKNGQLGTVRRISTAFRKLTVTLDSGQIVSINVTNFPHIELGYAITTHKAQGISTEDAYVLAGGSMQDREVTYVQASRGKKLTRFYLTETDAGEKLSDISRQMAKSRRKELALSVLEPEKTTHISF